MNLIEISGFNGPLMAQEIKPSIDYKSYFWYMNKRKPTYFVRGSMADII